MTPKPKPAPHGAILSVSVRGCSISQPLDSALPSQGELDNAVWIALRRFNYDPIQFKGWVRVPASPGAVAVRVS